MAYLWQFEEEPTRKVASSRKVTRKVVKVPANDIEIEDYDTKKKKQIRIKDEEFDELKEVKPELQTKTVKLVKQVKKYIPRSSEHHAKCRNCDEIVEISDIEYYTTGTGNKRLRGVCSQCGRPISKQAKKTEDEKIDTLNRQLEKLTMLRKLKEKSKEPNEEPIEIPEPIAVISTNNEEKATTS
jgi:hypothetical protein